MKHNANNGFLRFSTNAIVGKYEIARQEVNIPKILRSIIIVNIEILCAHNTFKKIKNFKVISNLLRLL